MNLIKACRDVCEVLLGGDVVTVMEVSRIAGAAFVGFNGLAGQCHPLPLVISSE